MIKLCEMLGGSHSYGLNTSESDIDNRYVFLNSEISQIVGLERYDCQDGIKNRNEDSFGFELRRFFNLLKRGNTQCLELLWNKNWVSISDEWKKIQSYKKEFIDLDKCYNSTKGYAFSERKLVNGEKTGQLGGTRQIKLKQYGYSPKNAVQAVRLLWACSYLLEKDEFPVNVKNNNENNLWELLIEIKTSPQKFNKENINTIIDTYENFLDLTYKKHENKAKQTKFNEKLANELLLKFYLPILNKSLNINQPPTPLTPTNYFSYGQNT